MLRLPASIMTREYLSDATLYFSYFNTDNDATICDKSYLEVFLGGYWSHYRKFKIQDSSSRFKIGHFIENSRFKIQDSKLLKMGVKVENSEF